MVLLRNEKGVLPLKEGAVLNFAFWGRRYMYLTSTRASMIVPGGSQFFCGCDKGHSSFSVNEGFPRCALLSAGCDARNMLERPEQK